MGLWHVEEHYGKSWFPLWGADERKDSTEERGAFGEAAFGWGLGREETEKQEERKRKEQLRENRERGVAVFREDKRGFPGKLIMIFQSFFFLIIIIYPLSSCCFWVLFASLSVDTPIVWFLLILWDECGFIVTVFFVSLPSWFLQEDDLTLFQFHCEMLENHDLFILTWIFLPS